MRKWGRIAASCPRVGRGFLAARLLNPRPSLDHLRRGPSCPGASAQTCEHVAVNTEDRLDCSRFRGCIGSITSTVWKKTFYDFFCFLVRPRYMLSCRSTDNEQRQLRLPAPTSLHRGPKVLRLFHNAHAFRFLCPYRRLRFTPCLSLTPTATTPTSLTPIPL